MLTADLVKVRRKRGAKGVQVGVQAGLQEGVVELVPRGGLDADEVALIAGPFVDAARALDGAARAELVEALDDAVAGVDDVRLGRALKKLVLDACDFGDDDVDCAALRTDVFGASADAWRAGAFDRAAVLAEAAQRHALTPEELERRLFADLKDAQRVRAGEVPEPHALAAGMPVAELQALLLRAERARFAIEGSARDLRSVLGALKLHQLLYEVEHTERGLALTVEGPMALFQQSTRYGLKLALVVPHVLACARARIEARLRLRKHGSAEQLVFEHARASVAGASVEADVVPEAVGALIEGIAKVGGAWRARPALDVLAVPGYGALVPDLVVEHQDTGEQVFIEVLGFWSRQAVWKRVELVERGLPFRVVFCVSDRLRVSEAALPETATSSLLVYKGVIPAARLVERLDVLARDARVQSR